MFLKQAYSLQIRVSSTELIDVMQLPKRIYRRLKGICDVPRRRMPRFTLQNKVCCISSSQGWTFCGPILHNGTVRIPLPCHHTQVFSVVLEVLGLTTDSAATCTQCT